MEPVRGSSSGGIYDINMTPLIDVSLVLVVILMVATPLALQSSIAVDRTGQSGREAAEKAAVGRVEITVAASDTLIVNRRPVPRRALGRTLRPLFAQSATRQAAILCLDGVTHGDFVGVLDEVKESGAAGIAVVRR
jgi:biopolymer transport protein ExbD